MTQVGRVFESIFSFLPEVKDYHSPHSALHSFLKYAVRKEVDNFFSSEERIPRNFNPFGELIFPYHPMGNVDSRNLFDLDELIIFSFYWSNRKLYKRVLDGGANIGLHTIILSKCGYDVSSYEPDPVHFEILRQNVELNHCEGVNPVNAAISTENGSVEFIRVLGNTSSSHIAGFKPSPYGELERFRVKTREFQSLVEWADLVKLDVEGHESKILLQTTKTDWLNTDAMVEVGSDSNAIAIFNHFQQEEVSLFAQKINWDKVQNPSDMPTSYRDGSLFISCKEKMPWG